MKKGILSRNDARFQLLLCILLAVLFLAIYLFVVAFSDVSPVWTGLILLLLYCAVAGSIYAVTYKKLAALRAEQEAAETIHTEILDLFKYAVGLPYAVVDTSGRIQVANRELQKILGVTTSLYKGQLADYCAVNIRELLGLDTQPNNNEEEKEKPVTLNGRQFRPGAHKLTLKALPPETEYYMVVFYEVTELLQARSALDDQKTVVAYIVLDNLEELAQYVRVSFRSAANEIEGILKSWAGEIGGMLREYERDKYILLFSQKQLENCIENQFDILETIRNVRLGDNSMPVTVSMGISTAGATLAERERDAAATLDLALQRGGDQVALRRGKNVEYFGGRTKTVKKRTKVRARVSSAQLCARIAEAKNVLIMGHRNPDFDSVGACIGIARLCMFCGVSAKVIINRDCDVFRILASRLMRYEEYADMFIDGNLGLDLIGSTTLLIVVDTNNFVISEAPEVAANVPKIAIIDHHRQVGEFDFDPVLNYIDPSASSACELIAEILEQSLPEGTLLKEEANAMLTGIMLDTNRFTKDTGSRTFAAALYLQGEGANTEIARRNFEDDIKDFMAEASFSKDIVIYRERMAITRSTGTGDPMVDRIAASKAADKLLTVRQVDASFALVEAGSTIHISARSNGTINVQLILEKLKGGGHFDAAGAQVQESTMEQATALLTAAIDEIVPA
ncbi:MAG: DHH family phosphoesterase [Clostridia bacterium]|nr:DHH family phosphoesterase [Clostridia bacterium]